MILNKVIKMLCISSFIIFNGELFGGNHLSALLSTSNGAPMPLSLQTTEDIEGWEQLIQETEEDLSVSKKDRFGNELIAKIAVAHLVQDSNGVWRKKYSDF